MAGEPAAAAWRQLGEVLQRKRAELDPRYANMTLFASERGINYRVAWDIEHGARLNYRRPTRRAIEVAYGVGMNFIDDFIEAAMARATAAAERPPDLRFPGDPQLDATAEAIWQRDRDDPLVDDDLRRGFIELARRKRQQDVAAESGGRRRAAG